MRSDLTNEVKKRAGSRVMPVLSGFFIMGFVDLAGIAASYVKRDFGLNDTQANLIPMLAFLWFILLSVPTGMLMGRIGRKNTALLSLLLTFVAILLPLVFYNFTTILLGFAVMGMGNTMMQVSFNPLLANVVPGKRLTGFLTFGQFTRSIASFLGPLIAGTVVSFWGDWKLTFYIYMAVTAGAVVWLFLASIPREPVPEERITWKGTFALLRERQVMALFLGILFFVGIDVGLNTTIPRFLMERTDLPLEEAGLGTSLYFAARVAGSVAGGFLLLRYSSVKFLRWMMCLATLGFITLLGVNEFWTLLVLIFLLGLSCANIFSILLGIGIERYSGHTNEVTAIILMGVAGGALSTPLMGMVADQAGQTAGMAVLLPCLVYLLILSFSLKRNW